MFFKEIEDKVNAHISRNYWKIECKQDIPKDIKLIMDIWSFKRKRYPNSQLNKHKSRLFNYGEEEKSLGPELLGCTFTSY